MSFLPNLDDDIVAQDEKRLISVADLPTPAADLARGCAHDLLSARDAAGHVKRHLETSLTAVSPAFDFGHADSHADELTRHLDALISDLKRLSPAIAAETDLLSQAMRQAIADVPEKALPKTCSHLLLTARVAAGHVRRHLDEAMAARTPESVRFNTIHALGHIEEVRDHLGRLTDALKRYLPAVGREIDMLDQDIWAKPGQEGQPQPAPAGRSAPAWLPDKRSQYYPAVGPDIIGLPPGELLPVPVRPLDPGDDYDIAPPDLDGPQPV